MNRLLIAAAALASLLASPAAATMTYDVAIPTLRGGADAAAVVGTITTDGTLGQIDESAILDWSLSFAGTSGLDLAMTPADGALGEAYLFAWGLIATAEGLYLSTALSPYFEVGYFDPTYASEAFFQFSSGQFALTLRDGTTDLWTYADGVPSLVEPGWVVLAEAQASPVPAPAAAWLLGAGLAGLSLIARRRPEPA